MTVIYYDPKSDAFKSEALQNQVTQIQKILDDKVIVLPKDYDIILNCSVDQLLSIKAIIDTAIAEMLQKEQPSTYIESNSKYLN